MIPPPPGLNFKYIDPRITYLGDFVADGIAGLDLSIYETFQATFLLMQDLFADVEELKRGTTIMLGMNVLNVGYIWKQANEVQNV